jgi:hypothetical protein
MKTEYQNVLFRRVEAIRKQKFWECVDIRYHGHLGVIKWYESRNQYCFFMYRCYESIILDRGHIDDISIFIVQLEKDRI